MNMLRDFVYLDWERVRSLAAQLFQGVPETSTREHGSSLAVEGRVEGEIRRDRPGELRAEQQVVHVEVVAEVRAVAGTG